MKKIYFRKCNIRSRHTGFDCPCEGIVLDWDNIKILMDKEIVIKKDKLTNILLWVIVVVLVMLIWSI